MNFQVRILFVFGLILIFGDLAIGQKIAIESDLGNIYEYDQNVSNTTKITFTITTHLTISQLNLTLEIRTLPESPIPTNTESFSNLRVSQSHVSEETVNYFFFTPGNEKYSSSTLDYELRRRPRRVVITLKKPNFRTLVSLIASPKYDPNPKPQSSVTKRTLIKMSTKSFPEVSVKTSRENNQTIVETSKTSGKIYVVPGRKVRVHITVRNDVETHVLVEKRVWSCPDEGPNENVPGRCSLLNPIVLYQVTFGQYLSLFSNPITYANPPLDKTYFFSRPIASSQQIIITVKSELGNSSYTLDIITSMFPKGFGTLIEPSLPLFGYPVSVLCGGSRIDNVPFRYKINGTRIDTPGLVENKLVKLGENVTRQSATAVTTHDIYYNLTFLEADEGAASTEFNCERYTGHSVIHSESAKIPSQSFKIPINRYIPVRLLDNLPGEEEGKDSEHVSLVQGGTIPEVVFRLGEDIKFKCKFESYPLPNITWKLNGETLEPFDKTRHHEILENGTILRINALTEADSGRYSCVGANSRSGKRTAADTTLVEVQGNAMVQVVAEGSHAAIGGSRGLWALAFSAFIALLAFVTMIILKRLLANKRQELIDAEQQTL